MPKSDQGAAQGHYLFIPRTLIFITREDKILLIKGTSHKRLWANKYNGLGGHIERGEDMLSSARRELLEESGLNIENLWLCGTVTIDNGSETGILLFVLRGESHTWEVRNSEEGILEWIAKDAILDLPLVEDLPVLLPVILSGEIGKSFFSAHYFYDKNDILHLIINS